MAENSVSDYLALQDENTTTSTQTQIIKSLEVQRLNNKLEEQCIHHFNLIKYLTEGKVRLNGKTFSLRSGNFIMFLKTNLGYLFQAALKNMQLLVLQVRKNMLMIIMMML